MLRNNKKGDSTTTANSSHIIREPFDYTVWQRDLYKDVSVKELYDKIKDSEKDTQLHFPPANITEKQEKCQKTEKNTKNERFSS